MQNAVKRVLSPRPHAGQRAVFGNAKRFNWLDAGRRWRKTSGLMHYVAIPAALERQQQVVWTAPTHKQTMVAWEECQRAASSVASFNKTEMTATFPRGRIMFFSMEEPDNARGHSADGIVMDEASETPEVAWHEVLRPMLLDTQGWFWAGFTPKGRNWTWREWMAAGDDPRAMRWQVPSLGVRIDPDTRELIREPHPLENPELGFEELQQIWRTTPERAFRQEYLAEFLDDGGGVFRGVHEAAIGQLREPYLGSFGIGGDLGKINDFTVLTVIDLETKEVVDWARFNQIDWFSQQARIKALWAKWSVMPGSTVSICIERNMAGDPIIEALRRDGLPVQGFHTNVKTKRVLIEDLILAIERGTVKYPPIPELISELQAYEQERLEVSGTIRYGAPDGLHDDAVISLALAWRLAKHGKLQPSQNFSFVDSAANSSRRKLGLIEQYRIQLGRERKVIRV